MCYRDKNHPAPDLKVFLNDLPGNDFNTIFRSLPSFFRDLEEEKGRNLGACFISGTPGSFHGRLFPKNFLHFVHSSCSIHWLSEVRNQPFAFFELVGPTEMFDYVHKDSFLKRYIDTLINHKT
ncbi:hypothetical protein Dimus_002302 [Dionaea muscipula]